MKVSIRASERSALGCTVRKGRSGCNGCAGCCTAVAWVVCIGLDELAEDVAMSVEGAAVAFVVGAVDDAG